MCKAAAALQPSIGLASSPSDSVQTSHLEERERSANPERG